MPISDKKRYNLYMCLYMKDRYQKQRLRIIHVLGGKCAICGSKKELEIDHTDKSLKEYSISKIWKCEDILIKELEKCQLLCKSCHNIKTIQERGKKISKGKHGTLSTYRYCKCEKCRAAKSKAYYEWKEKQQTN